MVDTLNINWNMKTMVHAIVHHTERWADDIIPVRRICSMHSLLVWNGIFSQFAGARHLDHVIFVFISTKNEQFY